MANIDTERRPLVDDEGNVIGAASREECHNGSKLLHPVVHLHVADRDGRLLLQKRSMNKRIQPGKWDTAVGGHVDYGESIAEALRREAYEEIGFKPEYAYDSKEIARYVFESEIERELISCNIAVVGPEFVPTIEMGEADELRFWTLNEIREAIGRGVMTPNFEREFFGLVFPYMTDRYGR